MDVTSQIVEIVGDIVAKASADVVATLQLHDSAITAVHYIYGHPEDIIAELVYKTQEGLHFDKYPLVGLFLDVKERKGNKLGFSSKVSLNMFIATGTLNTYTPTQRTLNSFKPVLIPVYDALIRAFKASRFVEIEGDLIPHEFIQRYKWGKTGLAYYKNGDANVFNDYVDAIELQNLEIDFKTNCTN